MAQLHPDLVQLLREIVEVGKIVARTSESVSTLNEYIVRVFLIESTDDDEDEVIPDLPANDDEGE